MIVIGSNTSDNGPSCFTEDVFHFMEYWQNRLFALITNQIHINYYHILIKQINISDIH